MVWRTLVFFFLRIWRDWGSYSKLLKQNQEIEYIKQQEGKIYNNESSSYESSKKERKKIAEEDCLF